MKLLLFLTWREIRFRFRHLLPFILITAALVFAFVSLVTFQESAQTVNPVPYMTSPTYAILFAAFALISFTAARTCFVLYSEQQLRETGTLRALGMKKRFVRRIRLLLGLFCIASACIPAIPASLLFVRAFVGVCTTVDMESTNFVPLSYRIPIANIGIVLALLTVALLTGVLAGYVREDRVVTLLRRSNTGIEAENGGGNLPEEGTLSDYGKLFVRRSLKRCVRYNAIIAMLLILPMIFVLGASTFRGDHRTHTFYMRAEYDLEKHAFSPITEEMLTKLERMEGVEEARGGRFHETHREFGFTCIYLYTNKDADTDVLRPLLRQFAEQYSLSFEDSAALRRPQNLVARSYRIFFLTESAVLLAAGLLTAHSLLKARLHARRRELSVLRALGARMEDLKSAVTPETVADFAAGAFLSILLGAFGFLGMVRDGGGSVDVLSVILLCLVFLAVCIFAEVRQSGQMTEQLFSDTKRI